MTAALDVLAIDGGRPVRSATLPYGRQWINDDDLAAVTQVLQSDWLTTGPKVAEFEAAFARVAGTSDAVAVSNGTAALHSAMAALGIGPGDEVIVPAITFAASSNAAVYVGATPVFVDIEPDTLLIDPAAVAAAITPRTRAIVPVDLGGLPCDYGQLRAIADQAGIAILADACHAVGGAYHGRPVGSLADLTAFSLHPVKHITAGEGGLVTTNNPELARGARQFRNHGITTDHRERELAGSWEYDMVALGYNYRLSDIQCALGLSQLRKLPEWIARRRAIAARYDDAFADLPSVRPSAHPARRENAYHLYILQLELSRLRVDRAQIYSALRAEGIGVNVHYRPVYRHTFYRERFGYQPGLCPEAEAAYSRMLSLPLFPLMTDGDVADVISAVRKVLGHYGV